MDKKKKNNLSVLWKILNAVLAAMFAYLIADAWIQILYFKNAEKHYYYFATLFTIPLFTCLIVVFGWDLDKK
ncbi:MAG: hypothetical protein LH614_22300 [Pyrinomonadaceae bacterium]|nr:hypothetical protein [Pyrinomonadaceae bacterium]